MATGDAFEALVLAAGSGSRFGGGKLMASWGSGVLLEGALAAAFVAPVRSVTVVIGADAEAVAAASRSFDPRVLVVHAPNHAEGMAASLRTGVASLSPDADGAFVFLGDMPRVPTAVLQRMADAVIAGALAAAPVFEGRRGNPVLLSRTLFPDLLALTGDAGARGVLQGLGERLALVESPDDGVLFDVDVRGDLSR
ncbi:nucleotidyltransferase family protein [Phenylobacterium sp.]|uniref:nucleotidyltransferase family protein n=1 Tax=Phenylobacterium sp. TaxID=1871053 RepID=UPI00120D5FA8|nr:nucleotidyltransferase family protein [Phenylobacterium sp.]THD57072.1 MAG: nucleotidyltransferase family protein [Phenylobacterium sp.]